MSPPSGSLDPFAVVLCLFADVLDDAADDNHAADRGRPVRDPSRHDRRGRYRRTAVSAGRSGDLPSRWRAGGPCPKAFERQPPVHETGFVNEL